MTSTPVVLLLLRSGQASDRPSGVSIQAGQLALDFGAADPGLYFEDSTGTLGKIGPPSYGPTAPNSSPVGAAGNYRGELWTNTVTGSGFLQVWDGSTFTSMNVNFANQADTSRIANFANSALVASGVVLASGSLGALSASGSLSASGALISSGTLSASGSLSASGTIFASGSLSAITASGTPLASGALGAIQASGALSVPIASGTVLASGSLGTALASGALGTITASGTPLASGALGAILASGALQASGVEAGAGISISGLPDATTTVSGALYYNAIPSGTQASGLFVRVYSDWVQLF